MLQHQHPPSATPHTLKAKKYTFLRNNHNIKNTYCWEYLTEVKKMHPASVNTYYPPEKGW